MTVHSIRLASLFACCLITSAVFAQVNATLSATAVVENQPVKLTITAQGEVQNQEPDMSLLRRDFELSGTSTSSQVSIFNGRFTSSKSWSVTITPRRTGRIEIPPITVGNQQTNPLVLTVSPLSAATRQFISQAAFFETKVSHREQYTQTAIYVSRTLFFTDQARLPPQSEDKPLDIPNATVLPLGTLSRITAIRDGARYTGYQWKYALFAERSGRLIIPSETLRIGIAGTRSRTQIHVIKAEEQEIQILPIPSEYPSSSPWFTASQVELTEVYDPADPQRLELGNAVTRTVSLRAKDSYESALLPFSFENDPLLRTYPEQAVKSSELKGESVWGTLTQKFNHIPVESGDVEIPEYTLTWWNTQTRQVERTSIPSRRLIVPSLSTPALANVEIGSTASETLSADTGNSSLPARQPIGFFIAATIAILGWLVVGVLLIRNAWTRRQQKTLHQRTEHESFEAIRTAIQLENPALLKQAMLRLVSTRLGCNLVKARGLFKNVPESELLLTQIDENVYGNGTMQFSMKLKDVKRLIEAVIQSDQTVSRHFSLDSVMK